MSRHSCTHDRYNRTYSQAAPSARRLREAVPYRGFLLCRFPGYRYPVRIWDPAAARWGASVLCESMARQEVDRLLSLQEEARRPAAAPTAAEEADAARLLDVERRWQAARRVPGAAYYHPEHRGWEAAYAPLRREWEQTHDELRARYGAGWIARTLAPLRDEIAREALARVNAPTG